MLALQTLDIRTVYLIAGLAGLLSAVTVLLLRNLHKPSRISAVLIAGALACGGVCLVLASGRTAHSSPTHLWASLMCAGTCFAFLVEAIRQLYGRKSRFLWCIGALVALGLALSMTPTPRQSLVLHFGFQTLTSLLAFSILLRSQDQRARLSRIGLLLLFACLAIAGASRCLDAINTTNLTLASPDFKFGNSQGPAVVLYTLAPLVMMSLILSILNARQVSELTLALSTDELTGLASRRFLLSSAFQWRANAAGTNGACSLLLIDVDNFKSVNDRYGHETGDHVLRHIANTLQANLRKDTILARYGGEEFCALLPVDQLDEARLAAERLRVAVQNAPFPYQQTTIATTISIGIATHGSRESIQEALRVADRRVYQAKNSGRNRVVSNDLGELAPA